MTNIEFDFTALDAAAFKRELRRVAGALRPAGKGQDSSTRVRVKASRATQAALGVVDLDMKVWRAFRWLGHEAELIVA